jgi:hypothetical protein
VNEETLVHWGADAPKEKKITIINFYTSVCNSLITPSSTGTYRIQFKFK